MVPWAKGLVQRVTDPVYLLSEPQEAKGGRNKVQLRKAFVFTSFPQRIPHVSTPRAVLALASWRNCGQSLPGTTMWRSPSIVGAVMEKRKISETMGRDFPRTLRVGNPGRAMSYHCPVPFAPNFRQ